MKYKYDIVISFAGENRDRAETIAGKLKANTVEVFYDSFEESGLWGKDLYQHLSEIYSEKARYCIILISEYYAKKNWTSHELKSAQERAFKENREYILPVRLDDTKLPGIPDTVGYIDLRSRTLDDVVNATLGKLGKSINKDKVESEEVGIKIDNAPRMPKIDKMYSGKQKEDFLYESFEYVKTYIKEGLNKLEENQPNLESSFREIDNRKFLGKIYKNKKEKQSFKIWIGGMFAEDSICYSEGSISIGNDNSFNEAFSVQQVDNELQLNATVGTMGYKNHAGTRTQKDAAAYLWDEIIRPLEI